MAIWRENRSLAKFFSIHILKCGLVVYCYLLPAIVYTQVNPAKGVTPKDSARAFAQQDSVQQKIFYDSVQTNQDSSATKFYDFFKRFSHSIEQRNIAKYREDTISTKQDEIIEEIKILTREAESYLNNGLDTTGMSIEQTKIEKWYRIASDGVFINTGSIQTHRNLETSFHVMRELLTRTMSRKESLDNYYKNLVDYRNTIDSLYQRNVLYQFPSDSVAAMRYINKLLVAAEEIKPIDSAIKKTIVSVTELQTSINRFGIILNTGIDNIGAFQRDLSRHIFRRETSDLGGPVRSFRPFDEIIRYSMVKSSLAFVFYFRNEIGRILLLFGIFCACAIFLVNLKRHLQARGLLEQETKGATVLKYPVLSALVIVLNIFQFIFIDPPFILNALLWTISLIALIVIVRSFITQFWITAWLIMLALFLLVCGDNLILQASRQERWIMVALSAIGIICGLLMILMRRRYELNERLVIYFVAFVVVMQIISVAMNISGRYNLAKTTLTSGFFNLVVAVLFLWTVRFINEGLALASEAYKVPGRKLFGINFDRVGNRAPVIFYILLIIGWFVLFARNFYAYKIIASPITNFIQRERTIGDFSFTIGSMLLFFVILYLTGVTSRLVSFFALDGQSRSDRSPRKGGFGGWILVVRISIMLVGFLLALAAIGLPMDRLTIVLSALGVGIGFGLQSLVNNLVSGLIISFEKPVNVGDIVEVGGRTGTIKSIGFRSSIIAPGDGSDVVIPNGDLLSHQLVNWTRAGNSRSVNIITTVAQGTEMKKAIGILKALPGKDTRILSKPEPSVMIRDFSDFGIPIQLTFWVENISESESVKSDMILAIDSAFRENGIEVPVLKPNGVIRSAEKQEKVEQG